MHDPIKAQTANVNTIRCRDCLYRDRTTITVDGEVMPVGITRGTCLVFDGIRGNLKPHDVYYNNALCPMYEQDETAERFWEDAE